MTESGVKIVQSVEMLLEKIAKNSYFLIFHNARHICSYDGGATTIIIVIIVIDFFLFEDLQHCKATVMDQVLQKTYKTPLFTS